MEEPLVGIWVEEAEDVARESRSREGTGGLSFRAMAWSMEGSVDIARGQSLSNWKKKGSWTNRSPLARVQRGREPNETRAW